MNSILAVRERGQNIWLDNISRDMLNEGTLERYRDELGVTGLTSNPTIFEEAIKRGRAYDEQIQVLSARGMKGEQLFAELALADLRRAADLFRSIHEHSGGADGWVSMEVSPLLIADAKATLLAAKSIHMAADRPNLFVKIPGSAEGVIAIEEAVFAGIPVNVTLLFSTEQYLAVANAYMRALERRLAAGLNVDIPSVASVFVSRWDRAVADKVPDTLQNKLGIAVAKQTYKAYWELLNTQRWRALASARARPQRLLWASTGNKDQRAPSLYVEALIAPNTIITMPEKTLLAFASQGVAGEGLFAHATPETVFAAIKSTGIDMAQLAVQLQRDAGKSFSDSWNALLDGIARKLDQRAA